MIQLTPQMRILVGVEAVDFRKGIDGLARLCREVLMADPFSGWLFVFRNRRQTALRILVYDGQGFWLAHNQLASHYTSFGSMKATRAARSTSWFQRLLCLIGRFGPGSSYR